MHKQNFMIFGTNKVHKATDKWYAANFMLMNG